MYKMYNFKTCIKLFFLYASILFLLAKLKNIKYYVIYTVISSTSSSTETILLFLGHDISLGVIWSTHNVYISPLLHSNFSLKRGYMGHTIPCYEHQLLNV